jgi:sialate O-acetylesterase
MKKGFFALVLLFWQINGLVLADVRLPKLVGDNMVLQQNTRLPLWGWAAPGEKVTVSFQGQKLSAKAGKDGKWTVTLSPVPAGGPYQMTIQGKNTIQIKDILVGEVWLASGQSNMEWRLSSNVNNFKQEIANADFPQIRLIDVNNAVAFRPLTEMESDGWKVCSPQTAGGFSAVAYFFARDLHQRYKVPIGLVTSEWGGTPAEAWTSGPALKAFPEFGKQVAEMENDKSDLTKQITEYNLKREAWLKSVGDRDRGYMAGGKTWADADFDASAWKKMQLPSLWEDKNVLPDYDGVVWLRKELQVPADAAGKPITLHLASIDDTDSTSFNGRKVGSTTGYNVLRVYTVPGELVKAGRNVIAVRVVDTGGGGGIYGDEKELYASVGGKNIPLTGDWSYQAAVDVTDMPKAPFTSALQNSPATLFNAMIAPLIPYAIKGAIWYQGESNAGRAYRTLFPAMIKDWRSRWGYDFPFLFVQLANYMKDKDQPADYEWAELREAQTMTLSLPNTGMAVTIDIGDPNDIHPLNKLDVGLRLAMAARKVAYGEKDAVYSGPTYASMTTEGGKVRVKFANTGSGLVVRDKYGYVRGFSVAGADKKFVWAKGYQDGNDLILYSDEVKNPVAVRYGWSNNPEGNIYNKEGLPAVPFRTDDWPGITMANK